MKLAQLDVFIKEIGKFPLEVREDIFNLIRLYVEGHRLSVKQFKTFKLDKDTKIQEFKVKDNKGNWRAISCIIEKDTLVFVYAFHKKSQALLEKDKKTILKRVKGLKS